MSTYPLGVTFQPGRPLPSDPVTAQERTMYHHVRAGGAMATMARDGGAWPFRQLHGQLEDAYASGGWNDLQAWLKK
ncbi:hypothetical protein [Deinococcus hohokamensis]|uniref:Uncharacterized protein n=1 Tax=Deinococcus hohokamensis TaxID=309883 RepID=A0ABV9I884_9DEIO